jgi:uncharacterized protein with GYD domain
MQTFVMLGKYSSPALAEISSERTVWVYNLVKESNGRVKEFYALLGEKDLILIVELPGIHEAIQVSIALSKHTGIAFSTSPAVTVDDFDKLAS